MKEKDVFFFYNALFEPISLINKNLLEGIQPQENVFKNAFGVSLGPEIFPEFLSGKEGTIEEPPIPANWHSDIAEFGAVFRSIELNKRNDFVMCELGCAWGCWMNISGTIAKRKGNSVHLIGIEGDYEFLRIAKNTLLNNSFSPNEFRLVHGIVASSNGTALFPKHDPNHSNWGFEPLFNLSSNEANEYLRTGKYDKQQQISLSDLINDFDQIDLLHVDIQGGEEDLIPSCLSLLSEKVSYMVIGTHSRQIEGKILDCLLNAGWLLEIERPAILKLTTEKPLVTVDGVQGWRNPRLLPINYDVEPKGTLKIKVRVDELVLSPGEESSITVEIINNSNSDWESAGPYPVFIAYHWLDRSGNCHTFDGERTNILGNCLKANESKEQLVRIIAPLERDEYILVVTLVQEGKRWFTAPDFLEDSITVMVR